MPKIKCENCGKEFVALHIGHKLCHDCHTLKNEVEVVVDPEATKAKIASLISQFTPTGDIIKIFKDSHKIKIKNSDVQDVRKSPKWQPLIAKQRREWLAKITDIPIANKRYRLDQWQRMLERASVNDNVKEMRHALVGARDEMEGKRFGDTNYSLTMVSSMSDDDLLKRKAELINKLSSVKELKSLGEKGETLDAEVVPEKGGEEGNVEGQ